MSTEIVRREQSALAEQMEFARTVTAGQGQSILPEAYRGSPANVLIAVNLGQAMGLSPAESLYRIAVIKGKPSASAELIAANVRKAGHRLRVRVQEDPPLATATIIRADDPDEPTTVTRDMAWAQRMGLANEPNYKKQPATMLSYRAITACARLACPEALYGVAYTPDELTDEGVAPQPVERSGAARMRAALAPEPPAFGESSTQDPEPYEAEVIDGDGPITDRTRGQMFALLTEQGITDADTQRHGMSVILGREVESRSSLTEDEGRTIVLELQARAAHTDGAR